MVWPIVGAGLAALGNVAAGVALHRRRVRRLAGFAGTGAIALSGAHNAMHPESVIEWGGKSESELPPSERSESGLSAYRHAESARIKTRVAKGGGDVSRSGPSHLEEKVRSAKRAEEKALAVVPHHGGSREGNAKRVVSKQKLLGEVGLVSKNPGPKNKNAGSKNKGKKKKQRFSKGFVEKKHSKKLGGARVPMRATEGRGRGTASTLAQKFSFPATGTITEPVTFLTGTAAFSDVNFYVNPGLSAAQGGCFTWLPPIAANFEYYKFRKLRFIFKSNTSAAITGNGASGEITMTGDMDVADVNVPNMTAGQQLYGFKTGEVFKDLMWEAPLQKKRRGTQVNEFLVRSTAVPAGFDAHFYDVLNFQFLCQGAANTSAGGLGQLFVEYAVDLFDPHPPGGSGGNAPVSTGGFLHFSGYGTGAELTAGSFSADGGQPLSQVAYNVPGALGGLGTLRYNSLAAPVNYAPSGAATNQVIISAQQGSSKYIAMYICNPATSSTGNAISQLGGGNNTIFNGDGASTEAGGLLTTSISMLCFSTAAGTGCTVSVSNATVVSATDANWDFFLINVPPTLSLRPEEQKLVGLLKNLGFKLPKGLEPNKWTIEKETHIGRFSDEKKEDDRPTSDDLLRYTREELMTWKHRAMCADDELKRLEQARNVAVKEERLREFERFQLVEPPSPDKTLLRAKSPERAAALK